MILKIDYDPKQVIHQGEGRILLKVNYYSAFASSVHLATTRGETISDFNNNDAKSGKTVFVGVNGGLSLE